MMATCTAMFVIGGSHHYDGGITPTYCLYLTENSRPALTLAQLDPKSHYPKIRKTIWIPTLENLLEDALLMIALNVSGDAELIDLSKKHFTNERAEWVELYDDADSAGLSLLYEKCRSLQTQYKVAISIYEGSTIRNQLAALERYQNLEVEVCVSQYRQSRNIWDGSMSKSGAKEKGMEEFSRN